MHEVTHLSQYVCVIYVCLGFMSPLSCKRKSSVSDSNHLHFHPSWKWNKKELKKRDGVKKTWGKRYPSLFISLSTHLFTFFLKKKYSFLNFEIEINSGQQGLLSLLKKTVKWNMLVSLYLCVAFYREKYLRTDQNRGSSIDLTLSFQIT